MEPDGLALSEVELPGEVVVLVRTSSATLARAGMSSNTDMLLARRFRNVTVVGDVVEATIGCQRNGSMKVISYLLLRSPL